MLLRPTGLPDRFLCPCDMYMYRHKHAFTYIHSFPGRSPNTPGQFGNWFTSGSPAKLHETIGCLLRVHCAPHRPKYLPVKTTLVTVTFDVPSAKYIDHNAHVCRFYQAFIQVTYNYNYIAKPLPAKASLWWPLITKLKTQLQHTISISQLVWQLM